MTVYAQLKVNRRVCMLEGGMTIIDTRGELWGVNKAYPDGDRWIVKMYSMRDPSYESCHRLFPDDLVEVIQ